MAKKKNQAKSAQDLIKRLDRTAGRTIESGRVGGQQPTTPQLPDLDAILDSLTPEESASARAKLLFARSAQANVRAQQAAAAAAPQPPFPIPGMGQMVFGIPPGGIPGRKPNYNTPSTQAQRNRIEENIDEAITGEEHGIQVLVGTVNPLPHTLLTKKGKPCRTGDWIDRFGLCYDADLPKEARGGMYDPWLWISGPNWGRCYYPNSTAADFKSVRMSGSSGRWLNTWPEKSNYIKF